MGDAKIKTDFDITDEGHLVVNKTQEVQGILDDAAAFRADSEQSGLSLNSGSMTYVGTIPSVVVAQWQAEGFYVASNVKSGLNEEEHQRELLRRLQALPALLTSRHKRLV